MDVLASHPQEGPKEIGHRTGLPGAGEERGAGLQWVQSLSLKEGKFLEPIGVMNGCTTVNALIPQTRRPEAG